MGQVRVKKETGKLYFDFAYLKKRCKEYTALPDTASNRKKLQKVLDRIEAEIALGQFEYGKYFPSSKMLPKIEKAKAQLRPGYTKTPLFKDFAETWYEEFLPSWRVATAKGYRAYIDNRLVPEFGEMEVGDITKSDILQFRARTAKLGHGKLKAKTINKFVKCLNMILNEAADRYNFTPPHLNIKPLKEEKVHIEPFSLDEVNLILANIREDWRDYVLIRFFTGLRTGEVDGLRWENIDFNNRQIQVRETFSGGRFEYTKNDGSQREVDMSTLVYQTLLARKELLNPKPKDLVFALKSGAPVHASNFLRRVWTPILNRLKIKYRKPYQTRHTAATLWLAAGENPNWIARQLGHSSTNMLFTVYARYVPNLTHQDGSAMDRLLTSSIQLNLSKHSESSHDAPVAQQAEEEQELAYWENLLQEPNMTRHTGGVR